MTNPEPTNPPNPQPPHAETHVERQPVVVQPQSPDTGLVTQLSAMGKTLAGLPEQLVNAVREANQVPTAPTQPAQQPATTAPQQQPGTNPTDTGSRHGPKVTKFAKWWRSM